MPIDPDAFRHHPRLRGLVRDPEASFFRNFNPAEFDETVRANGGDPDWRYPDHIREAMRHETLDGRLDRDLWVFGYGSLMWDPGFHFAEVRRARIEGYHRALALFDDNGGRGSKATPGLMAALVEGGHCDGVAFRIDAASVAHEVEVVWRREMIGPGYLARFLPAQTDFGPIEVLAFVGDRSDRNIRPDLPRETVVRYVATGAGILGTSREYLENMLTHFAELGISDPELESLMAEVTHFAGD